MAAWLESYGPYAILLIPAFAFGETCLGLGLFVSSLWLVLIGSALYQGGHAELQLIFLLAFFGSTVGDHTGFFLGRWLGPGFHELRLVRRNRRRVAQTEALVTRFGPYAIFIGRFFPAVRCLLPAMLGISGFPQPRYTPLDLLASALWALALCGILFGIDFYMQD